MGIPSKRKQRRVNDSGERPAIDFGCENVEDSDLRSRRVEGEDGEKGSRRNKRDTTGIYDRPPHYYSMNFNAKRTVSRRDTRGGFFAKAKTRGQRRRQKISV